MYTYKHETQVFKYI